RMAVSEAVMTCGLFIGAALGGMLYQAMGMRIALAASCGVLILGIAIMFLVIRIIDMSAITIKESTI
ncbi:MAG: hypothetical protein KAJ98_08330, partial [Spirochaetaceae bacterium]|nr:hypothetical protein [Spirochaetaceae bacterium]